MRRCAEIVSAWLLFNLDCRFKTSEEITSESSDKTPNSNTV